MQQLILNAFSSFLRTIPNDNEQTQAIIDLLLHYNWKWIGAIAGDDNYGRSGISNLKKMAREKDICIEYTAYVSNVSLTAKKIGLISSFELKIE